MRIQDTELLLRLAEEMAKDLEFFLGSVDKSTHLVELTCRCVKERLDLYYRLEKQIREHYPKINARVNN